MPPSAAAQIQMFIKEQNPIWNGCPYKNHAELFDINITTYDAITDIFILSSQIYPSVVNSS